MRKRLTLIAGVLLLIVAVPVAALFWFYESNFARTEGEYFDSDGVTIHYTMQGEGEPVVLVHGFAFNADLNWRSPGVIDALAKKYKVIALDNRGHGLSGKPTDVESYGEKMPKDIINLLDHLKIEKAHVIGYSMGGFITLKLTAMYPERLLSSAPCGMGWGQMDAATRDVVDRISTSLEQGRGFGPLLERLNIKADERGVAGRIFNYMLTSINNTLALAKAMRGMPGLTVNEPQLRANQVPVLSIVGRDDPLADNTPALHETMANHELVYLEHADHVTALRHPDFIPALVKHLEAHPAGSWSYDPNKQATATVPQPAPSPAPVETAPAPTASEATDAATPLPNAA